MPDAKRICFTVLGIAQPGGSKRAFKGKGMRFATITDANPKAKPWKAIVAATAREHYDGPLLQGPLRVSFRFVRPRLKGHFRKDGTVKPSKLGEMPTTKPDVLKLARAAEDALTAVVWLDDAQIVEEYLHKEYGEPARVEVTIEEIPLARCDGHR